MKSSAKKVELASVDDLFTTEESRADAGREKVVEIPLSELHPFKGHPFKVKDDDAMMETADSIRQYGVLVPAIARPDPEGGYELLGYARQVIQQMELLEDRYVTDLPQKTRFGVSAQHYTFTENAFVELVKKFGQERYEFYFNATSTHQILEDVKNRISDLGIIYLSKENGAVIQKVLDEYNLQFTPLFYAKPHVFLQKHHPLATRESLVLDDLRPFPRLNFVQGSYESAYYSEELYSTVRAEKQIHVNDRGAIVNFMLGLNAYTISSGIFPKYLHGDNIVAIPLNENEQMQIGYILNEKQELSELGLIYINELRKYAPET